MATPTGEETPFSEGIRIGKLQEETNPSSFLSVGADGVPYKTNYTPEVLGVNQKDIVYVDINGNDTTAVLGNARKPFFSLAAALDAVSDSEFCIIKLGIGNFSAPPKDKLRANIAYIGSGKPVTDSLITILGEGAQPVITAPTKLIGGTVIKGSMWHELLGNVKMFDLGVDVGAEWCAAHNSGNPAEGLLFAQYYNSGGGETGADGTHPLQQDSPPFAGVEIENISVLTKNNTAPVHCVLMENLYTPKANNISTYCGMFGFVSKSIGGNFSNMDLHGHSVAGMILKSNDYAHNINTNVTNIYITSIGAYDGEGLMLQGEEGTVNPFINASNLNISHTKSGIHNVGKIDGFSLVGAKLFDIQNDGVNFTVNVAYTELSNVQARNIGGTAFKYDISQNNVFNYLNNCLAASTPEGFNLNYSGTGGKIKVDNLTSLVGGGDTAFDFGSNIWGDNISKVAGASIGVLNIETSIDLATVTANGGTTSVDLMVHRISGNPAIVVQNGSGGSFPLIGLVDNRTSGVSWNIENGRVNLGELEFLNGVGGAAVIAFSPDGKIKGTPGTEENHFMTLGQMNGSGLSYLPDLSGDTNVTSITLVNATYTRIGNIINASIGLTFTPTTPSLNVVIEIDLPVDRATISTIYIGGGNFYATSQAYPAIASSTDISKVTVVLLAGAGIHAGNINIQYSVLD